MIKVENSQKKTQKTLNICPKYLLRSVDGVSGFAGQRGFANIFNDRGTKCTSEFL